jgi:hypothetical protein
MNVSSILLWRKRLSDVRSRWIMLLLLEHGCLRLKMLDMTRCGLGCGARDLHCRMVHGPYGLHQRKGTTGKLDITISNQFWYSLPIPTTSLEYRKNGQVSGSWQEHYVRQPRRSLATLRKASHTLTRESQGFVHALCGSDAAVRQGITRSSRRQGATANAILP